MSGVSPGQRGLRSKTSELNLFRDRGSNTSRLHSRPDHHLVPPVPALATPDYNKPKRKLALWGKRRKSGSVSPSQSARPSGDSTGLFRKSGETVASSYKTVQSLSTRRVYVIHRYGVVLTHRSWTVARTLPRQGYLQNFLLWMYLHHLSTSLLLCLRSHLAINQVSAISTTLGSPLAIAAHLLGRALIDR